MRETVVFWDIDGTLIAGSLERYFFSDLLRYRRVTIARAFGQAVRLALSGGLPARHKLKLCYIGGQAVDDVAAWADECWRQSIRPRLFPEAIEAVNLFAAAGARQVLLSGTPRFLADRLAEFLNIDNYITAEPEIHDGQYTGRLIAPHPIGIRKAELAKAWLKNNGGEGKRVIALGNHRGDRFLLNQVNCPIAVNPDDRLRSYAQQQSWIITDTDALCDIVKTIIDSDARPPD